MLTIVWCLSVFIVALAYECASAIIRDIARCRGCEDQYGCVCEPLPKLPRARVVRR